MIQEKINRLKRENEIAETNMLSNFRSMHPFKTKFTATEKRGDGIMSNIMLYIPLISKLAKITLRLKS